MDRTTRLEEGRHLASAIYAESYGMDWTTALRQANRQLDDLLQFAAEWDQHAHPTPEPPAPVTVTVDPQIEAAWTRALHKAEFEWAGDARPRFHNGRAFVASRTTGGVVYLITGDGRCSCEAGQHSRPCWHVALVGLAAGAEAQAA